MRDRSIMKIFLVVVVVRKIAAIKWIMIMKATKHGTNLCAPATDIYDYFGPKLLFAIVKATSLACRAHMQNFSLSRVVAAFSPPNNIGVNIGEGLISIKDNRRTGIY